MKGQTLDGGAISGLNEKVHHLEIQLRGKLTGWIRGLRLMLGRQGLILTGQARTYYAKQIAQHELMVATELPIMTNDIEVL